ncbi:MAG TPA: hypothetical protein VHF69_13645 [Candidatus Synoicihabitans sp.]|nr:hypothetical protein [Candidatus Synoicihabitans sp.]
MATVLFGSLRASQRTAECEMREVREHPVSPDQLQALERAGRENSRVADSACDGILDFIVNLSQQWGKCIVRERRPRKSHDATAIRLRERRLRDDNLSIGNVDGDGRNAYPPYERQSRCLLWRPVE